MIESASERSDVTASESSRALPPHRERETAPGHSTPLSAGPAAPGVGPTAAAARRTDRFAPATLPARPHACRRYLKVRVRDTAYGVPATQVREIVYQPELSEAASAESNGNSLANLRGHVIPVLDAAVLVLGPDHWRADLAPDCLVVLELGTCGGSQRVIGLLVDGVEEVVQVRDGGTNPAASPAPLHASREVSSLPCLEHLIRAHLGT